MKLFQKLLITPAVLGLLTPLGGSANELNLSEVSGYSSSEEIETISEFNNPNDIASSVSNLDELEPMTSDFEAGSFSSTTTMSGSASFAIGALNNSDEDYPNTSEAVNTQYSYNVDLNTSFNGDDNLYVGLEAGSANGLILLDSTNINATTDTLYLNSLFYSLPVGGWDLAVGPKLDQDDLVATTTTKYSDSFLFSGGGFGNNVWTLPGLTGSGIAVQRVFDNGFNIGGNLIGTTASTSAGMFTKEGFDVKTIMVGYDGDNFGGGVIYTKYDDIWDVGDNTAQAWLNYYNVSKLALDTWSVGAYWSPSDNLTTNIGADIIEAEIGQPSDSFSDFTISADYAFNENNSFSAAWTNSNFLNTNGTVDKLGDAFEFYYTHNVNDSMTLKGGVYIASPDLDRGNGTTIRGGGTGDDFLLLNETIYALETTFKF